MLDTIYGQICCSVFELLGQVRHERGRSSIELASWKVGRKRAKEHQGTPNVVLVPTTFTVQTPEAADRQGVCFPEDVRYRLLQRSEVFIWDASPEETQHLHFDLLEAVNRHFGDQETVRDGRWMSQDDDKAAWLNAGNELIWQPFDWPIRVPGSKPETVEISVGPGEHKAQFEKVIGIIQEDDTVLPEPGP